MACVILKKGEGRGLSAGGAWIYDNEIDRIDGDFEEGGLVAVSASNGYPLGTGYINTRSRITVRMLTRDAGAVIDETFWERRVRDAIEYRLHTTGLSSCRLIFGEADRLPGLTVDKFHDILVTQTLSLGMERLKAQLFPILLRLLAEYGHPVRGIYERNDARSRALEGLERTQGFFGESFDPHTIMEENGLLFEIDVENGQKTGFFLDQRYNRAAIRPMSRGARVLDCFCNAGGFGLNAAAAGAAHVTCVDASQSAVDTARANAERNGLAARMDFLCADVFELLPELEAKGAQFDLVILDPPAFAKSRAAVKSAARGYREINRRGLALVRPGGFLATCTCSHFMTPELFRQTVSQAAHDAKRRLLLAEERAQAPDHPVLWGADESAYLKFLLFQVLDER